MTLSFKSKLWPIHALGLAGALAITGAGVALGVRPVLDRAQGFRDLIASVNERDQKAHLPWHFKLLLVVFAVYLGWRLVQGVEWVVHHV